MNDDVIYLDDKEFEAGLSKCGPGDTIFIEHDGLTVWGPLQEIRGQSVVITGRSLIGGSTDTGRMPGEVTGKEVPFSDVSQFNRGDQGYERINS